MNLGSVNYDTVTSEAQLESVGLAWDKTNFPTTGLMGLQEVSWLQLNNANPLDGGATLTATNSIRSADDGFTGDGVNATLTSESVSGAGWSLLGQLPNGTAINAGSTATTGTTVFGSGSSTFLNGATYTGTVTAVFNIGGNDGTGNPIQSTRTWALSHVATGETTDSGQATVNAGQSYGGYSLHSTGGAMATLLGGTASAPGTVSMVDTGTASGISGDGVQIAVSGASDIHVVQFSFDPTAVGKLGARPTLHLASLGSDNTTWANAVNANTGGTANFVGNHPYNSSYFALGNYGVDTTNNVVWAVVNYNGTFGVAVNAPAPVPALPAWGLGVTIAGLLIVTGSRIRRSSHNCAR